MIVCSCNVITEEQVRAAVAREAPRTAAQVQRACGCTAQCGSCAKLLRRLVDECHANDDNLPGEPPALVAAE